MEDADNISNLTDKDKSDILAFINNLNTQIGQIQAQLAYLNQSFYSQDTFNDKTLRRLDSLEYAMRDNITNINDLQKLKSRNEAEKLELEENFEIDKIGCGFNYLLILTNNKQGILNQNYEKNKFIYLNSETKSDFNEIFNGPFHFFLQTL